MSGPERARSLVGALILVVFTVAGCGAASGPETVLSTVGSPIAADEAARLRGQGGDVAGGPAALRDDARIIRTGSLNLQVTNLDAALRGGRDVVGGMGGYIGASRLANDGGSAVASISYRIPADRWDEALDALRKLGKVIGEQTDAVEVTGQLVDLEARIRNLRASEVALQKIATTATKITDVLEVERRLSEVRGQIEQLDAQRADLEDRAAYATLTVTFGIEVLAVTEAAKGWDPGTEVDRATGSLIDVLQALTTAGIWFVIVWVPILLGLGLVAGATVFVLRRLGFIRRAGATEPAEPAPAG